MIDVSIYMEQLEVLRRKLLFAIDGFWIDMNNVPHMGIEKMMQIYFETGVIFINSANAK